MNRSVGIHSRHSPDTGFVPVAVVAADLGCEFVAECEETCPRLVELLESKVPDTQFSRGVIAERLLKAQDCADGPRRKLGRACCTAKI